MFLIVIVILLLVFISLSLFVAYVQNYDLGVDIPSPPKLPIIGHGHLMMGDAVDFLSFLHDCWKKHGRRYRVDVLTMTFIILTDPKDIEVVLASNDVLDKAEDYGFLHPWLGQGLLTSTGEKWRRHRKFLTPAFHFSILKHFVPIFERKADIFVEKLKGYADNQAFDVYPLVTECTLDQVMETAMGINFNSQQNVEYVNAVKNMTTILNARMKGMLIRFDTIFKLTPSYEIYEKSLKYVHDFTNRMIRERRKLLAENGIDLKTIQDEDSIGSKKTIAFLDLLLLGEVDGQKLSDTSIREEVDTFLFEGHDTTASAIAFTLYLLASNQDVQEKVFEEQYRIFGNDSDVSTTYRNVQEMKYLEMAIKETLRLFPSVPLVARNLKRETLINDMMLPAGCDIGINVFSMGRDPEIFPDPMVYRPERFLPEECNKRHNFSVVSFSAGPRNCIGQKFAMYEIKMTVSKLIRNFRIIPADAPPLKLAGDIVLKSANGIPIKLMLRKKEL